MCQKTRTFRGVAHVEPEKLVLGDVELVMMHYTGLGMLTETGTFKGLATGTLYRFGMDRTKGFVDARDAPGLLATFEDGLPVFQVVQ